MSDGTIQFSRNGINYVIHPNGYISDIEEGIYFPVRQCPNCGKITYPEGMICGKCNTKLEDIEPVLAKRTLRTGRKYLIAAGMWGLINGLLLGGKVHLGALPTILILGGCYFIAGKCCGTKMEVDEKATKDYRAYCEEKQEAEELEKKLKAEGVTFEE